MPPDRKILAFDTSAAHCAAALLCGDVFRQDRTEHLKRGQAERLMPMLGEMLSAERLNWSDLDAVAVGIGPGNFTGIRISVAAARGLGLSLEIPVVGVSSFEAMRKPDGGMQEANEIVSLEAPRGQAYVQHFSHGRPHSPPRLIDPENPPDDLRLPVNMIVTGHKASRIARHFHARAEDLELTDVARRIARTAARRLDCDNEAPERPAPLYVRPPDAAPPRLETPVILR